MSTVSPTLQWPPTREDFITYMKQGLAKSDQQDVTMLVYCDNPSLMIFDPIEHMIRCDTQVGTAQYNGRTIKVIIGKED